MGLCSSNGASLTTLSVSRTSVGALGGCFSLDIYIYMPIVSTLLVIVMVRDKQNPILVRVRVMPSRLSSGGYLPRT